MKIIIGLGNPGKEYELTRHNFGFMVLDRLAELNGVKFKLEKKFEAEIAEIESAGEKTILVKPQTFMNSSGKAVLSVLNFYKIAMPDLLLVYDDKDLEFGTIKTTGKSSAGHKGVESIINLLKTNNIKRIRLGINNNLNIPTEGFVLQKFTQKEIINMDSVIIEAIGLILNKLEGGNVEKV